MQFIAILLWGAMSDFIIKDQNNDHRNFSILQNILSKIKLTAFERSVYWAIKECAGENGSCTKSYAKLAEMAGMSVPSLKRTLTSLSEENKILQKPLIQKTNRLTESGDWDTNEIILIDIWGDNNAFFQKSIGGITQTSPQFSKNSPKITQNPGVGSHRPEGEVTQSYNKEPINKNPYKEEQQQAVAVFSCLEKISENEVSRDEKIKITKKYQDSEQTVIDAVNSVLAEGFEPRETLLKSLRAALRDGWKSTAAQPQDTEQNRKLAQSVDMKTINLNSFMASREGLEICRGHIVEMVSYAMPKEKFLNEVAAKSRTEVRKIFQGVGI